MRGVRGCAVALCAFLVVLLLLAVPPNAAAYTPRAPILIEGDSEFTAQNGVTGGSGTSADPYVIEGWEITGRIGIEVRNTTAHFVIRNSYVHDTSEAIHLQNLSHARIGSNVLWNGGYGVIAFWVTDLAVSRNTIATDFPTVWGGGVHPFRSSDVRITENRITRMGDGVYIQDSTNVVVASNRIEGDDDRSEGVRLWVSTDVTIACNDLVDHSIAVRVFTWNTGIAAHHNNVVSSAYAQAQDGEANEWDDGYPSGGNHWSDYAGEDRYSGPNQDQPGPDGIGDTPYGIDTDSRDRYPLIGPAACASPGPVGLVSLGLVPRAHPAPGTSSGNPAGPADVPPAHRRPCGDRESFDGLGIGAIVEQETPDAESNVIEDRVVAGTPACPWPWLALFLLVGAAIVRVNRSTGEKP